MNLVGHPLRGPAGRRAVVAAAVIGLLALSLSAAEGGLIHLVHQQPSRTQDREAEVAPGPGSSAALAAGIRLLHQAVRAARRVSYQGVQIISWRTPGGSGAWLGSGTSRVEVDVRHIDGGQASQQPDGVLGLTPALAGLLCAHYAVLPEGTGSADGRPARIVEAFRRNGTLAARFWLDSATKLPLRRELFDPRAQLISDDDFVTLTLGARSARRAFTPRPASAADPAPLDVRIPPAERTPVLSGAAAGSGSRSAAGPPAGSGTKFRPWTDRLGPAQVTALRAGGWPVPGSLPGGLAMFHASQSATATGRVVDLAYSDGLSVVSLFVQRGRLPGALPGWRETGLGGNRVYVNNPGEPDLTWSAGGFVYTMVAGAPAPTVAAAVDALPHQAQPGFWGRIQRGLRRLWSWINPFG